MLVRHFVVVSISTKAFLLVHPPIIGAGAVLLPIDPRFDDKDSNTYGEEQYWMLAVGSALNRLNAKQAHKLTGSDRTRELEVFLDVHTKCEAPGYRRAFAMSPLLWVPEAHRALRHKLETAPSHQHRE